MSAFIALPAGSTMFNVAAPELLPYVREIQDIGAVGQILETVASVTGLGFVAVAHVTCDSWTTCAVLDKLNLGLKIGDGLDVTTTLCEEVRATASAIVIDHVRENDQCRDHHTPRIYGFQSYFSIPLFRPDGGCFGTLCGCGPQPAAVAVASNDGRFSIAVTSHGADLSPKLIGQLFKPFWLPDHSRSALRVAG